jgi:hypothetical protein
MTRKNALTSFVTSSGGRNSLYDADAGYAAMASDKLSTYKQKRFPETQEPCGQATLESVEPPPLGQPDDATRLHHDLRLEFGGLSKR